MSDLNKQTNALKQILEETNNFGYVKVIEKLRARLEAAESRVRELEQVSSLFLVDNDGNEMSVSSTLVTEGDFSFFDCANFDTGYSHRVIFRIEEIIPTNQEKGDSAIIENENGTKTEVVFLAD